MNSDLDGWVPVEDSTSSALAASPQPDKPERKPYYRDPEQFLDKFLIKVIRRRTGGSFTWCAMWWAHAEAVLRITAMWETWEHFRLEGALGMSTWLLQYADPQLAVLLSKDGGPFANCRPDRHSQPAPFTLAPAPAGLWAAAAFSDPDSAPSSG